MQCVKKKSINQQLLANSIYFLLLLLYCCTPVRFTSTVPGQPKAEYYSFSKSGTSQVSSLLDTSVLYVYEDDIVRTYTTGKTENIHTYIYMLFKSNGIVLYSGNSREPFNQINMYRVGGQYCYYKVSGDDLQLEMYDRSLKKFMIMYAKIFPDRVHFHENKVRTPTGGKGRLSMPFKKTTIKYNQPLIWPE
jgi:hypothetical protein